MRILLTNDDGYQSLGIAILRNTLANAGHQVWVCAPDSQMSATSHSMTLTNKIVVTRYDDQCYHFSGTPADCILYGLGAKVLPGVPDLVVSGINHGYNLSTDILYSGTVGAASEAAMKGIPAIAISAMHDESGLFPFELASAFLLEHLREFAPLCSQHTLLNINVPPKPTKRWQVGRVGMLEYCDQLEPAGDAMEEYSRAYRLKGGTRPEQVCMTERTDYQIVNAGDISVSALHVLPALDEQTNCLLEALSGERR